MNAVSPGDRKRDILAVSARLLARWGLAGCTVRLIADEVGIRSGSLYHHFDSKEAIVEEIVSAYLDLLVRRYADVTQGEPDGRERIHRLVLASLEVSHEHPHAAEIYQGSRDHFVAGERFEDTRRLAAEIQREWFHAIDVGVAQGVFRTDVNPRTFHRFLRDAVFLSARWFVPTEQYGIADLATDTTGVFLDGFAAGSDADNIAARTTWEQCLNRVSAPALVISSRACATRQR